MNNFDKMPETINQLIDYVSGVKSEVAILDLKTELSEIESDLMKIKTSPELHNTCNLDFKINNPEYYLNKIQKIIEKNG